MIGKEYGQQTRGRHIRPLRVLILSFHIASFIKEVSIVGWLGSKLLS